MFSSWPTEQREFERGRGGAGEDGRERGGGRDRGGRGERETESIYVLFLANGAERVRDRGGERVRGERHTHTHRV